MMNMHLSLRVAELERSVRFYEAFFGVAPHKVRAGYANFLLADPPLKFALTEGAVQAGAMQAGAGSLDHLGFQVASATELEAFKDRLKTAGLATFDEKDAVCCHARQDKMWVHDPDGNEWEIYVVTDEMEEAGGASKTPMTMEPAHRCCG